ncbi:MAG: hypothetical protein GX825_00540, partial [Syntrophomonadaceae bacterium]|nr:hypothetical protein [Syntrophomonadaceae bacterium]
GKVDLDATVRVDGTIEVGLRSQQVLIIGEDGNPIEQTEGIIITREKAVLAQHIIDEINNLKSLAVQYAGTEAGTAFGNQAKFLEQELIRMGVDISGNKPLPLVWIDLIIVGDIKAEQPNINVLAEDGSLIGSGTLNASKKPALIRIINHSNHYLVLNSLIIPEREGGLLYFNYDPVLGDNLNATVNQRNKVKSAGFTINTSASAGSATSIIDIQNTYAGMNPPSIEVRGSIKNVGTQTNPGTVTITGKGGISTYGSVEAGVLTINAGGSFMQSYTDSLFNVGGVPRSYWGGLASWFQNYLFYVRPYPHQPVWYWPTNVYKPFQDWIDGQINSILNSPNVGAIRAENVFIAARYLNINGLIEAGRPMNEITLGDDTTNQITVYKTLIRVGLYNSKNYKDYPLVKNTIGLNLYYDPVQNAIVMDPLAVRGGYIELFGQIISTGSGKITALDGFGRINVNNQTDYDLIIKGLDTGIGTPGTIVITDTAKKKPGNDNAFLVTRYKRNYLASTNSYQMVTDTWYSDNSKAIISNNTANGSSATYTPMAGYRYEWIIGQKRMKEEVITYRSKSWLGADWLAKDPDNLYDSSTRNIGSPTLMPNGEYLTYRPGDADKPYMYWYQRRSSGRVLWGYRNWSKQSWFLAPKYYYEEYTYREGFVDVYYHSIKADYPIQIAFAGERSGSLGITSKGSIIIDGVVKNESGNTSFTSTGGSIRSNSNVPIATRNLTLKANTGIGGILPVYITLSGNGVLNAETNNGDISIKETLGKLLLGKVSTANGNVKLESKTGIFAENAGVSLVKGNAIDLLTTYGSIQGSEASSATPLRIDTGDIVGSGLTAKAASNINIEEISGSLRVISVTSGSGTDFADVILKISGGSLINPNTGEYTGNEGLKGFWNSRISGDVAAAKIAAYLEQAQLKRITDTAFMTYVPNITGRNINIDAMQNVGGIDEITITLLDGKAQMNDELIATLTAAEYGAVSFYDAADNKVDPTAPGVSVVYLKVNVPKSVVLRSEGNTTVLAGGSVYIESNHDLKLATISSKDRGTVRIRSTLGILNAINEAAVNIRGGDIILEAAGGTLGATGTMLTIQQESGKYLDARSAYDIMLKGVSGSFGGYDYDGSLGIGFIYTPTNLKLSTYSAVYDARNDSRESIAAAKLGIQAAAIGESADYLETDLADPIAGLTTGHLLLDSTGNIYLRELYGNMYITKVKSTGGNADLRAFGSIYGSDLDTAAIEAVSIALTALNGTLGKADAYLLIDTGAAGTLTAGANADIFIKETAGNLALYSVTSSTGDVFIESPQSITNGNPAGTNITARNARLLATESIGTVDKFIKIMVDQLEALTQNGGMWIHNGKDLSIGNFTELAEIKAGTTAYIIVSGHLLHKAGLTIEAGNQVCLKVDRNSADIDPSAGGKLDLFGQILSPLLNIYGGDYKDTILIQTASSLPHTVIETGAGNDSITLDELKPVLS